MIRDDLPNEVSLLSRWKEQKLIFKSGGIEEFCSRWFCWWKLLKEFVLVRIKNGIEGELKKYPTQSLGVWIEDNKILQKRYEFWKVQWSTRKRRNIEKCPSWTESKCHTTWTKFVRSGLTIQWIHWFLSILRLRPDKTSIKLFHKTCELIT